MRNALALLLAAPLVCVSSVAQAATTGAIRGQVVDEGGLPVPGVSVTLTGVNIAGERTAVSDADGRFRIPTLPPGSHELLVKKEGFATMRVLVTVRLDETATVPITMVSAVGTAEIVVEEVLPVIDTTKSSISTNLDSELIQNLPVGRSYQSVVRMLPGVSGRVDTQNGGPSDGNPSVRGEGQYGNNFLMDGISTRDPVTKTFGMNINFDAIEEVQVYTDGLPAEFSQATGMLVNVVLKDGADEHFGTAGYFISFDADPGQYDILNLETGEEEPTDKRNFMSHEIALTAGGPIVQEKLWYMAALTLNQNTTYFEATGEDAEPYTSKGMQGFGKITWFPTPNVSVQYMGSGSFSGINNYDTSGLFEPEAQAQYRSTDFSNIGTIRLHPNAGSELEIKGTYIDSNIDVVPMSGDSTTPLITDVETGQRSNNWSDFDYNNRKRLGATIKYTQLVDGVLGDHRFKVGAEGWRLTNTRELVFTGPSGSNENGDYQGVDYLRNEGAGYPCTKEANYTDCYGYTEHVNAGVLGNRGIIVGGFVQDDWQPVDRLTLNIGARVDSEILYANYGVIDGEKNAGDKILGSIMPAPRTGLAWDVTGDGKNLVTVNYGRYYDIAGNSFADWGSTRSANVYKEYQINPDTGEMELVWVQDPATDPLIYCTAESLEEVQALEQEDPDHWGGMYDLAVNACSNGEGEENISYLRPYHSDKLVVGYTREILPNFALGIRGIMSATSGLPEDIDYDLDAWVITNPNLKSRDYRALELVAERKFDGRWQLLGSYTLSEAKGHMPGQFELASGGASGSNGNGVGVYMDDIYDPATREFFLANGYGWLVDGLNGLGTLTDDQGYYGYLPYHSFHQVKLNGSYTFDWVGGGTTVGAAYEWNSGRAWQKRGLVGLYGDYFAFPEGRGTRFMPAVHYFDLRVAHALKIGDKREVEFTADVFNVLGLEAPITYYENDNESFGKTMYRQSPRSLRLGARFTY
ncbi:MAG: TonB-dependent receptor [Alphaproteobacteria bacterium]|nr:TonB-dependent receptor [Alphaproteobacteria bacterium]